MTVLSGAKVVTPDGVLDAGWVEVDGAQIAGFGSGVEQAASGEVIALDGGWLVPGFIDLHVHGGGGHDFATSAEAMSAGVDFHLSCGTTRSLVSIMAGSVDDMCEQLGWVAEVAGSSRPGRAQVAGAHLEGPFLAHAKCGAQNPHYLLAPDRLVLAKLLEAGQGLVRTVTLAPELPGALALIGDIVDAGGAAAVGHTDASYEEAMAGFDAGASLATHLFNAMGAVNQREPGASVAAIEAGAWLELINDGVHVHDALTRLMLRDSSARAVLITDAISATGAPDGEYVLGGQPVVSRLGTVRVVETGRLAGSTLTMDAALRRTVQDLGLPITLAVAAASANPARALGIEDRCGSIAVGLDADLVHLSDDLQVCQVMVGGQWVDVAPQR